jgi:hypothetical protein
VNPYVNEEVMWERLKDRQREADMRRRYGTPPSGTVLIGEAALTFGRMFQAMFGRLGRRYSVDTAREEPDATIDVA